ncbi:hypothetical protein [uncultured Muribaculum sp.]|uniref:hypothetical protein n=1 Tax=uncultured Muribaculum sp. TaxID=1918613 RepID=UPI00262CF886|nr:hypothetical protein [uncultured Muribaculum sp.]
MKAFRPVISFLSALLGGVSAVLACTSAIIGGGASASGRMLLWKHRDTGAEHSFVARVKPCRSGELEYVALFNGGDSLLREAWTGVNAAGFAVMNTASYNLAPDTARVRDREGVVMARALAVCRNVADFDSLLRVLPRPMGVQANFGAIDTCGAGAYFETCDTGFVRVDLAHRDTMIVRTNYSHCGEADGGYGYIREASAVKLLEPMVASRSVAPERIFTEVSRSFYHSLLGYDPVAADTAAVWIVDQDFIPRYSTGACVVIEVPAGGDDPSGAVMWSALGYPPCAEMRRATLDSIDTGLLPAAPLWRAPLSERAAKLKGEVFPIRRGSGSHYIYLPALRGMLKKD